MLFEYFSPVFVPRYSKLENIFFFHYTGFVVVQFFAFYTADVFDVTIRIFLQKSGQTKKLSPLFVRNMHNFALHRC